SAWGAVPHALPPPDAPSRGENWGDSRDPPRRCAFEASALNQRRVPRRLRRICLKAMAADPADRYPSAEALQKALKRSLLWPKVLAVLAGICALALVWRLGGDWMWPQPDPRPSHSPTLGM